MNKQQLKEFCNEIGIELVGIAGVNRYQELERIIKRRIENGHITGMEEPSIDKRVNPLETMDNAKSIIVCAFPYYTENIDKSNISKYCYGEDYHIVIKRYLNKIGEYLSEQIDEFEFKSYTDNGPLVDRYLAYISGIGYFGLNNNIITDKYGSYVFIGYMITNYEFKPDEPSVKTCIKCGKCVNYCPGNALLGSYEMNPKRCVSYMTQKKEDLTEEEKEILINQDKVFGCDICQDVCPHNLNIDKTKIIEFKENLMYNINEDDLNGLSNKEFKRMYGNKAFSWRGKKIIQRNISLIKKK